MKVVLSACIIVAVAALAAAAPAPSSQEQEAPVLQIHEDHPELYRGKRSHYGQAVQGVQYYSPCGGGAGPIPALAPSPYGHHAPISAYHAPAHFGQYGHQGIQGYGYGYPQYRDVEESEPAFSDMEPMMSEHIPMSRFAYAPAAAGHYGLPSLGGVQTTGPAFGVFPNANTGGCGVPLLLSCSPSIVPGRIVSAQPAGSYGGHDAYRSDEPVHEEESHHHDHQLLNEPAQANANDNMHQ